MRLACLRARGLRACGQWSAVDGQPPALMLEPTTLENLSATLDAGLVEELVAILGPQGLVTDAASKPWTLTVRTGAESDNKRNADVETGERCGPSLLRMRMSQYIPRPAFDRHGDAVHESLTNVQQVSAFPQGWPQQAVDLLDAAARPPRFGIGEPDADVPPAQPQMMAAAAFQSPPSAMAC